MFIDGEHPCVYRDGDGFVIATSDRMYVLTRGGAWSRNPYNAFRYDSADEAIAGMQLHAQPHRRYLHPSDAPLFGYEVELVYEPHRVNVTGDS